MKIFNQHADGHVFDVYKVWTEFILDTLLNTSMGLNEDIQGVKDHAYLDDVKK